MKGVKKPNKEKTSISRKRHHRSTKRLKEARIRVNHLIKVREFKPVKGEKT